MRSDSYGHRAFALPILALAGASLLFAACSSTKTSTSTATNAPTTAGSSPTTAASSGSDASITVSVANVAGVGNVLVDGKGRTLYILATERGGKVTCTTANGCEAIWPPVLLPSGMTHGVAGNGVQASLLGTVNGPSGDVRLTYGGWPLYSFTSDTGPGQAKGQGVKDTWGLWWVLNASGNPITTTAASSTATTATPAKATPATSPPATTAPAKVTPATSPPTTSAPATTAPSSGGAGF